MQTGKKMVIIGAISVFLLCGLYVFIALNGLSHQASTSYTPQANISLIPGGIISTLDLGLLTLITPTTTPDPSFQSQDAIQTGLYVQITGTGGAGLNIRNNSGTDSKINFLANESEVFLVTGGPQEKDGYIWWQLKAPYDESRQGWAAEAYLHLIKP